MLAPGRAWALGPTSVLYRAGAHVLRPHIGNSMDRPNVYGVPLPVCHVDRYIPVPHLCAVNLLGRPQLRALHPSLATASPAASSKLPDIRPHSDNEAAFWEQVLSRITK